MTMSECDMSLHTPRPIYAVPILTSTQQPVTKNAKAMTDRLRRHSPRLSQYVPCDALDVAESLSLALDIVGLLGVARASLSSKRRL